MTVKELDVVRLADGRTGTIIDVLDPGRAYLFEGEHPETDAADSVRVIGHDEISSIEWNGDD